MEASTYKANGNYAKELEEELMKFTTAYGDSKVDKHLVQPTKEVNRNVNAEVDITELTKSVGNKPVEIRQDTTESSSSFGDSGSEVEKIDASEDPEVSSNFRGDAASALGFDGFSDLLRTRRRKLTNHWRSFIQPLAWRCKWIELQIKKFQLQAKKYDKKLVEYSQQKENQFQNTTVEDIGGKSLPLSGKNSRNEVFRRKKRKRTEKTTDVKAYMSRHNLFSYYENKKSFEGAVMDDKFKTSAKATHQVTFRDKFSVCDESFFLEPRDGDNSMELILYKIEHLQSHLGKLKSRVDGVISENAGKFSWLDDLSLPMPSNTLTVSTQSTASPPENVDGVPVGSYIASQLMSEYKTGDVSVSVPESSTSIGRGEVDVNERRELPLFADVPKNGDEVLVDNQTVKEEMNDVEGTKVQRIEKPLVPKDELGNSAPVVEEPDLPTEGQPLPKIRSISKITAPTGNRKRGRRKGPARKSRRISG